MSAGFAAVAVIVKPRDASTPVAGSFDRLVELRGRGFIWLAWRLAGELRGSDAAAPLAAEGLALECSPLPAGRRGPSEMSAAPRLGSARPKSCCAPAPAIVRLSELADAIGVHPAHLARVFRAHYGLSVGEYGRRLRLGWAATEIAGSDTPLALIASQAGCADQSHFTRLFRSYVGITPARYREETRPAFQDK